MTRNRIVILTLLGGLPVVFLVGVGFYHLWKTDWIFWAWWPMAACLATTYILAWRWHKGMHRQVAEEPAPMHYTERDQLAWKRVEEYIKATDKIHIDEIAGIQLYADVAQKMAPELAAIYHPDSSDPMGNLTIPEIIAVVELAAHDLGEMAKMYLPGGHLVTIDNLRRARQAVRWYQHANNAYWAVSAVFDPIRTGLRYAAARAGLGKPFELFKDNAFLWFYANYVRRLGHYLIELNSGRLRVGVERYRQLLQEHEHPKTVDPNGEAQKPVVIAVIGQVKAGKSSLINAVLGERRAVTDVIPSTSGVTRYELHVPRDGATVHLLDTVGYNQGGPDADQFRETVEAAQQADLLFLVCHARNPGRQSDVKLWHDLKDWFAARQQLKMPPVILVLTHIDLLAPAMEWSPPYDWHRPTRPKEKNFAEAVLVAREQFGPDLDAVVPVCAAENRLFGIAGELIPEMTGLLGEARSVAFLRCLYAEADERQFQRIVEQVFAAGKALLGSLGK